MMENVKKARAASKDKVVYLRADQTLPYGTVVRLISDMREAGIHEVSLVTLPPETKAK